MLQVVRRDEEQSFAEGWDDRGSGEEEQTKTRTFKYVDDLTVVGSTPMEGAISHITTRKERRWVRALGMERTYANIVKNSENLGMRIHPEKTKILCISAAKNYDLETYMKLPTGTVKGEESVRVLGFTFGNRPGVHDQVKAMKRKFASKLWVIRHLKRVGIEPGKLVQIYTSLLRSSIEYGSVIYDGLLTKEQVTQIERLQSNALKTIYGWDKSYATAREMAGLETLAERRKNAVKNFAQKTSRNPRFAERWFPANPEVGYGLRKRNAYATEYARTERLRNAPLYRMRRIMNGEEVDEMGVDDLETAVE